MNDLQTLNPFSTKPRENVKVGPQNQVGGGMGFLDEWGELIRSPQQIAADGGQFIAKGVGAIGELLSETIKETATSVTGSGLDMQASLTFNEAGTKPNNLEEQKEIQDANYKRIVYSRLEESRRNAQRFAHERALDEEARLEVSVMLPEEKMKALHLNTSFDEKNIKDAYHIQELRRKKREQLETSMQSEKTQTIAASAVKVDLNSTMEGGTGRGTINISSTGGAGAG